MAIHTFASVTDNINRHDTTHYPTPLLPCVAYSFERNGINHPSRYNPDDGIADG